jgi:hypothetical protein
MMADISEWQENIHYKNYTDLIIGYLENYLIKSLFNEYSVNTDIPVTHDFYTYDFDEESEAE